MTGGPPYLLDTHIWFWYLTGSDRLGVALRDELAATLDALWLSPSPSGSWGCSTHAGASGSTRGRAAG